MITPIALIALIDLIALNTLIGMITPLAPEARIIPLDQAADARLLATAVQL